MCGTSRYNATRTCFSNAPVEVGAGWPARVSAAPRLFEGRWRPNPSVLLRQHITHNRGAGQKRAFFSSAQNLSIVPTKSMQGTLLLGATHVTSVATLKDCATVPNRSHHVISYFGNFKFLSANNINSHLSSIMF